MRKARVKRHESEGNCAHKRKASENENLNLNLRYIIRNGPIGLKMLLQREGGGQESLDCQK